MLDIRFIREHADRVKAAAAAKNVTVDIDTLIRLDDERRALTKEMDDLRATRRARPAAAQRDEGKRLKTALRDREQKLARVLASSTPLLEAVPNIPTDDTPVGDDETENVVLREVGERPAFDFAPKEHGELGKTLGVIDTERAASIAGSRFSVLLGDLALMEFALVQFALSTLTSAERLEAIRATAGVETVPTPFIPVVPPAMVRPEVLRQMARLDPRDDRYHIERDNLYLAGSAEHTMGPLHRNETLDESRLPLRYVGFSSCFRREVGSYGKDVHGIFRVHQFDKLEMESFTAPEASVREQDFLVAIQEALMHALEIPYRVVLKCTGDMGTPDARAIDIEAWMPGQGRYRETHTADLMTDYQARRLNTNVRWSDGRTAFAHMNDATVFAIGRTLIAIMENLQRSDGSVGIPRVLRPYLGNRETIAPIA